MDWRGYELHPETPRGGIPLAEYFPAARLPSMKAHVEAFAASFGIADLVFPTRLPNTRRALAVAEYARERARLVAFRDATMDAYWRKGRDIEKDDVLAEIATSVGLDPAAAVAAADDPVHQAKIDQRRREAEDAGVTGIPTFLFGERPIRIVGCQPLEVLRQAAEAIGAPKR